MGRVDAELPEDVLAMGVDGVDAGAAFGGYLLRRPALSDGFEDGELGGRELSLRRLPLLLDIREEGLSGMLADVAATRARDVDSLAEEIDRGVLEDDADTLGGIEELLHRGMVEVIADEQPHGLRKPVDDDEEVVLVGEVEEGEVDDDDGMTVMPQSLDEGGLILYDGDVALGIFREQRFQTQARQLLIISQNKISH